MAVPEPILVDVPEIPELSEVESLLTARDQYRADQDQAEALVKAYTRRVKNALGAAGMGKYSVGLFTAQMMYPDPRRTTNGEKAAELLLAAGVPLDVITRCLGDATTVTTPEPFLRVDKTKPKG